MKKGSRFNPAIARANGVLSEARRESGRGFEDRVAIKELGWYVIGRSALDQQVIKLSQAVARNMLKLSQKGIFDAELSVKAWLYVAKEAAKAYEREHGDGGHIFTMDDIRGAARFIADELGDVSALEEFAYAEDGKSEVTESVEEDIADRAEMPQFNFGDSDDEEDDFEVDDSDPDVRMDKIVDSLELPTDIKVTNCELDGDEWILDIEFKSGVTGKLHVEDVID